MNRPRRWAAALWTFAVTLVLAAVLGGPFTGDRLASHGNSLLARLITGLRFPQWSYRPAHGAPHAVAAWLAPMIADLVLALLASAIAALATTTAASSARARLAGLLAGWGLSIVAAAIAGTGRVLALSTVTHPAGTALSGQISDAVSAALWFGLATGWLTGIVLAAAVRKVVPAETAEQPRMAGAPAGASAEEVEAIRIWSPSDAAAEWQRTQDMPVGANQVGQPWPPAANPEGPPTVPAG
jgi:hypothetical protein